MNTQFWVVQAFNGVSYGALLFLIGSGLSLIFGYRVFERSISVMGNVSLSLFLAQALMSLRLWDLASLAGPVLIILAVQAIAMATYAVFITFRVMGANYDAAVLAAGHCGFGLGATPTAIASILVPIAVITRTPNACCRGFSSPSGLCMLSQIIFAPIAASRRPDASFRPRL